MWYWIAATLVAFYIKGLCGFANTMVFQSILSFHTENVFISPVELLVGYPSNAILAVKGRDKIRFKTCIPLTILLLLGSLPGALILKYADAITIKILCGIILILVAIEMLFRELRPKKMKGNKVLMFIVGLLCGILCGLFGIGVLLGAYFSRVTENSHELKANVAFVFFVENTFRIINYIVCGIITFDLIKRSVMLLPIMLLGLFAGMKSSHILDEKIIKIIVIVLIMLSGVGIIVMNT